MGGTYPGETQSPLPRDRAVLFMHFKKECNGQARITLRAHQRAREVTLGFIETAPLQTMKTPPRGIFEHDLKLHAATENGRRTLIGMDASFRPESKHGLASFTKKSQAD